MASSSNLSLGLILEEIKNAKDMPCFSPLLGRLLRVKKGLIEDKLMDDRLTMYGGNIPYTLRPCSIVGLRWERKGTIIPASWVPPTARLSVRGRRDGRATRPTLIQQLRP